MARKKYLSFETSQKVFAIRLSKLMAERNVNQPQLAAVINVQRQTISNYANGQSIPDSETLAAIASFFQVSADYLIGLRNDPTTDKDLQFIVDYTGLSSKTIEKFHEYAHLQGHESRVLDNFDCFINHFYARFLHRLLVLKQSVELARDGLSDDEYINVSFASLRQRLFDFSEFCSKIPSVLFGSDVVYDELEKKTTYSAITVNEKDIEDFLKNGLE